MQQLHAPPVRKNKPPGKVFQSDTTPLPLQPYDGPFKVIERKDKHFVLNRNGRTDTVPIDRLKPAHLDVSTPHVTTSTTITPPPTRVTCSGRQVCWRDRLDLLPFIRLCHSLARISSLLLQNPHGVNC
jgi:hypothetical protein